MRVTLTWLKPLIVASLVWSAILVSAPSRLRRCYTRQPFVQLVSQQFKSCVAALRDQGCYTVQWFLQLVSQWPPQRTHNNQLNVLIGWWAQIVTRQLAWIVARGVTLDNVRQRKSCETSIAEYVTLGNFSCNLCRNKIARQVGRNAA